ncbi:MAG: class I SAM-dependent methyltransferase [Lachnospiraceae bacterium]|nr:class I SAM-dependent methyltransferase [Lachnospiraceae bacterium]
MEAYTDFASVYDTFMDETPYEEWAEFLHNLIKEYGKSEPVRSGETEATAETNDASTVSDKEEILDSEKNLVLDLGCGTGTLTELLYRKGYDMIGVDFSQEMLNIAMNKKEKSGSDILYLCQDMRELDLYSTIGTVISACDSVNYLLEDEEVIETFRLINNYLYPGGVFIFDFNTVYKYEQVIGDTTIAENREECSFIWDNFYHEEECINEYDLTIFVKEENELFRKFTEAHYQRGYTLDEMKMFIKKAGLQFVKAIDADTHKAPTEASERIYVIAREQGK